MKKRTPKISDITGMIGDFHAPAIGTLAMYSFARPSCNFWQGAFTALRNAGVSEKKALDWLQSKNPRWMLDSDSEEIEKLGRTLTEAYIRKNGAKS